MQEGHTQKACLCPPRHPTPVPTTTRPDSVPKGTVLLFTFVSFSLFPAVFFFFLCPPLITSSRSFLNLWCSTCLFDLGLLSIPGTRCRSSVVLQAAESLHRHWTGSSELPEFTLQVDISPPLHVAIIGKGGANIKALMALTGTSVRFPAAHVDSGVFISGPATAAKVCHMYLQGLLPVSLSFDLPEAAVYNLGQMVQGEQERP